jgi:hypothetical protein
MIELSKYNFRAIVPLRCGEKRAFHALWILPKVNLLPTPFTKEER